MTDSETPEWPPTTLAAKLAIIDLAAEFYRQPGRRENAIRSTYQVTPIRFWQQVNQLITETEVVAARPIQCRRLRAMRSTRIRR